MATVAGTIIAVRRKNDSGSIRLPTPVAMLMKIDSARERHAEQFLVHASPEDPNAVIIANMLAQAGYRVKMWSDLTALCDSIEPLSDVLVISESNLINRGMDPLKLRFGHQPAWSHIAVVNVLSEVTSMQPAAQLPNALYARFRVFNIEQPIHRETLLRIARAAVMSQRRQLTVENLFGYRRRCEQALRENEERLGMALACGRMGVWEWDVRANRLIWSQSLRNIYGLRPGEGPSHMEDRLQYLHRDDRDRVEQTLRKTIQNCENPWQIEYRIVQPDGSTVWLEDRGQLSFNEQGQLQYMRGICSDITDRKLVEAELEEHRNRLSELVEERTNELEVSHHQLRRTERLAAMGTLAAGLGHDLGNLVFPMRIRLDMMQTQDHSDPLREDLCAIRNAVEYLQRLANGLRHMAMDPNEVGVGLDSTNLKEWWADVKPVLSNSLSRGITLEHEFEDGLPEIAVATHGLTQAVFNLVQNANEVMADRASGRITIHAERGEGNTVKLRVSDNGPGMPQSVRERCLEPFFTTKVRGISTGLGLSLVHGVVSRAGGSIDVVSDLGEGTTWVLIFPAMHENTTRSVSEREEATVTIADPRFAAYVQAVLRSLGVRVGQLESDNINELSETSRSRIWIVEDLSITNEVAIRFLNFSDSRHLVVIGNAHHLSDHPRVTHMKPNPSPDVIRQLLRRLLINQQRTLAS